MGKSALLLELVIFLWEATKTSEDRHQKRLCRGKTLVLKPVLNVVSEAALVLHSIVSLNVNMHKRRKMEQNSGHGIIVTSSGLYVRQLLFRQSHHFKPLNT